MKIELQKIPVWQETVEVSEVFDINPYMLDGTGSLLIVTNNGERLVDVFRRKRNKRKRYRNNNIR